MNLPNKITMFRVMMIPFFVAFLSLGLRLPAELVFVVASLSDALDGYIARSRNLITDFGKFMDPLADKLLVCSALVLFVAEGLVPAWVAIIIISREFAISGFRLIAAEKGVVIAAGIWGKAKTVCQMVMSILFILHVDNPVWHALEAATMWLSLALTVISLVEYIWRNKEVLNEK